MVMVSGFVDGWNKSGWHDYYKCSETIPAGFRPTYAQAIAYHAPGTKNADQMTLQIGTDGGISARGSSPSGHVAVLGMWLTDDDWPE